MSGLKILDIREATLEEWLYHWRECEYAVYFQSPWWGQIWESYSEGYIKSKADYISFSDGKSCIIPFGKSHLMKGISKVKSLSQGGTYGGPISSQKLSLAHLECIKHYLLGLSTIRIKDNPYNPMFSTENERGVVKDCTHRIPLKDGYQTSNWSNSHRRSLKKAIKEGVNVRVADCESDWNAYFKIYQKTLERWGSSASSNYSKNLFDLIRMKPNTKLWISCMGKKIISGALILYSKDVAIYWHGASDEDFFNKRPNHILFKKILDDLTSNNYSYFDFNPSGGHSGVERFKEGFDSVKVDVFQLNKEPFSSRIVSKIDALIFKFLINRKNV
ncbi:GNAT family N-acetyltransferase [Ekhidna sp.]|uniref:GNAT family N-acetyltransferase n=1 Tax=Ekhidna sp. TaxID=2608089 RepID=UPI003CCB7690